MGHWAGYVVEERWFFGGNEGIEAPPASPGHRGQLQPLVADSPPCPDHSCCCSGLRVDVAALPAPSPQL